MRLLCGHVLRSVRVCGSHAGEGGCERTAVCYAQRTAGKCALRGKSHNAQPENNICVMHLPAAMWLPLMHLHQTGRMPAFYLGAVSGCLS